MKTNTKLNPKVSPEKRRHSRMILILARIGVLMLAQRGVTGKVKSTCDALSEQVFRATVAAEALKEIKVNGRRSVILCRVHKRVLILADVFESYETYIKESRVVTEEVTKTAVEKKVRVDKAVLFFLDSLAAASRWVTKQV